jgi:hypothetical protein
LECREILKAKEKLSKKQTKKKIQKTKTKKMEA